LDSHSLESGRDYRQGTMMRHGRLVCVRCGASIGRGVLLSACGTGIRACGKRRDHRSDRARGPAAPTRSPCRRAPPGDAGRLRVSPSWDGRDGDGVPGHDVALARKVRSSAGACLLLMGRHGGAVQARSAHRRGVEPSHSFHLRRSESDRSYSSCSTSRSSARFDHRDVGPLPIPMVQTSSRRWRCLSYAIVAGSFTETSSPQHHLDDEGRP